MKNLLKVFVDLHFSEKREMLVFVALCVDLLLPMIKSIFHYYAAAFDHFNSLYERDQWGVLGCVQISIVAPPISITRAARSI